MKPSYLFFLIVLFSTSMYAQENGNGVIVALPDINVLYLGVPNPVQIAVPNARTEEINATVSNGSITKKAAGWEIQPSTLSEPLILTVLVNNQKIFEKTFKVIPIPDPYVVLAGKGNGVITKNELINTGALEIDMTNFLWDNSFDVESYSFLYSENGKDKEISVKGNNLTDEVKSIISKMESGQDVIFKDIKVVSLNGISRNVSPLVLSIY